MQYDAITHLDCISKVDGLGLCDGKSPVDGLKIGKLLLVCLDTIRKLEENIPYFAK